MLLTSSRKSKNSPNQDLVENNADLISQSSSLITAPSKPIITNMYSSPTNNALSNLDKQLRRFNGDAQRADEDRTQSFLNKVNAHIITHHLIAPSSSSEQIENHKSSFASFGKSSHNNQVTFSNGGGFFLHSNVFFQAPNKS